MHALFDCQELGEFFVTRVACRIGRRLSLIIAEVAIGTCAQQGHYDFARGLAGGHVQRCDPRVGLYVDSSTLFKQKLDDIVVPLGCSVVQRRPAADAVNGGALGKQTLYQFHIALESGQHQSRFAVFACCVDFNALGRQQGVDNGVGVHADGSYECGIAAVDDCVGTDALREHIDHDIGAVAVHGARKVSPVFFRTGHLDGTGSGRCRTIAGGGLVGGAASEQAERNQTRANQGSSFHHLNLIQKNSWPCRL